MTREWMPIFLASLRSTGNVRESCKKAGVDRSHAYDHKEKDEVFRHDWEQAIEDACDEIELAARKRAIKKSDLLAIFLLKAHRPEKYRDKQAEAFVDLQKKVQTLEAALVARGIGKPSEPAANAGGQTANERQAGDAEEPNSVVP